MAYLEDLAVTDELTRTLNRRGFTMEFSRAIDAARRGGPSGVLIICDLDGFKSVNDRLGHAFGDEVLRQVGALLLRGVRKMDVAARLGGDEFALLLIGADLPAAQRRIAMLRAPHRRARAQARRNGAAALGELRLGRSSTAARTRTPCCNRADRSMYAEKRRQPSPSAALRQTPRGTCCRMRV